MSDLQRCPKCHQHIISTNYVLHMLRCDGPHAGGTASARPSRPSSAAPRGPSCDEIAQQLTWARTQPAEVIAALKERLGHYKGMDYFPPGRAGRCVVTKEGVSAVNDAIKYITSLDKMDGVGNASVPSLAFAAEDHIADVGQTGSAQHASSDGMGSAQRVELYGSFSMFGECLWYGSELADARTIILDLIVDDGVPSRGHRTGIYNPHYTTVGVAYGPHATFGRMAAMEFARQWEENVTFTRARQQSGPRKIDAAIIEKAKAKSVTTWKLGGCALCGEEIKGGRVLDVAKLGGKLHADCFKCGGCSKQLTGTPFKVQDASPFCDPCFYERFGKKCTACNGVRTAGVMKNALGSFHLDCIVCTTCEKTIGKGPCSTAGGVFTCQACSAMNGTTGGPPRTASPRPGVRRTSSPAAAVRRTASPAAVRRAPSPAPAPAGRGPRVSALSSAGAMSVGAASKPKPKAEGSFASAKATCMGMAMDYASL